MPPTDPATFFTTDHRACDALWADVEIAVERGDRAEALSAWTQFEASMTRHLAMEEEVLFPALEAAGLPPQGPTAMMRLEHDQMRGLLSRMASLADSGDTEGLVDEGDTLLMLIQQHNAKEEGILYPIATRLLGTTWSRVAERLDAFGSG